MNSAWDDIQQLRIELDDTPRWRWLRRWWLRKTIKLAG